MSKRILVVVPEWNPSAGGIQRYGDALVSALQQLLGAESVRVLSFHGITPADSSVPVTCCGANRLRFTQRFFSLLRQFNPTLIWFTHINLSPYGILAQRVGGFQYVVSAHGVEVWNTKRSLNRLALKSATVVAPVSRYTRDVLLREQMVSEQKLWILPNTSDENRFALKPLPLKPHDPIILTVNRFERRESYHGYRMVLRALPEILKQLPNLRWKLAGTGNDLTTFQQEVSASGLSQHVELLGYVAEDKLPQLYQEADLFVMPSLLEGFGIVYLESQLCGTPCLAGNLDGSVDPLCDGALGILVNPHSTEQIAEGVVSYFNGTHPVARLNAATLRSETIKRFGSTQFHSLVQSLLSMI
ncbi:MAG: glycosyltransferase family 4 protein [Candidatus Sumerlaeia bacterium]|nr:glycosyltransferase family 4 protein [Candidatus Sumerlaeia bacterium]